MRQLLLAASLSLLAFGSSAFAQTTTTTTTVVTEEPAPMTRVIEVPSTVRTYVTEQTRPSVTVERQIVVGEPLPDTIEYEVIPDNDGYAYTVVNGQRVIIDPQTRSVIEVYE